MERKPKKRMPFAKAADVDVEPKLEEEPQPEAGVEPEPGSSPLPADAEPVGLRLERAFDDEDDFADGRSSAGVTTRTEEDEWGRGLAPEDRPFEESDVPPRSQREEDVTRPSS